MYFGFRTLFVVVLAVFAFIVPNINILLVVGGSILGTTLNIILPVLFYNRAYTYTSKNKALENNPDNKSDLI